MSLYHLLAQKGVKPSELADRIGVHRGNVSRWDRSKVPAERVLEVERVSGVSRHDLRPDLYPREGVAA